MTAGDDLFAGHRPRAVDPDAADAPAESPEVGAPQDASPPPADTAPDDLADEPGSPTDVGDARERPDVGANGRPADAPAPDDDIDVHVDGPRPRSGNGSEPATAPAAESAAASAPEPAAESAPEPVADPEPVAGPDPEPDAYPEPVADPEPDADPEPVADPEPDADPAPAAVDDPDATQRIRPVAAPTADDRPASVDPAVDPDQTVVMPLTAPPVGTTAVGRATPRRNGATIAPDGETWDTGTIRRWDASQTDDGLAISTGPLRRPAQLDDREEVTVERESRGSRWYEVPVMILTALTLAFLLRTFVVQVFYIPSGSMIPTLEVNDRIAVEKISYLTREPARGEVVVFAGDDPLSATVDRSTADRVLTGVGQFLGVVPVDAKDFVKRVIGLPGDQVSIADGRVSVNGVELDEPYARLDNDNGEWEVPPGMLFVMGDNRANSGDSRSALGYIPEDDVVGRAVMVIWPFDRAGSVPGEDHDAAVDAGS